MKPKFKPVARAEIREGIEQKFRARGAVVFHLLLLLLGSIFLLYNLVEFWLTRRISTAYENAVFFYGMLATTGALHYIRYHFRHGRGRDQHEQETEARVASQLERTAADEAEEQEELIRLQMADKLKNRRLVMQHLAVFVGVVSLVLLLPLQHARWFELARWSFWQGQITFAAVWGVGLVAHILRHYFSYGFSAENREAKIEALVTREMQRVARRGSKGGHLGDGRLADGVGASAEKMTLEELERASARNGTEG